MKVVVIIATIDEGIGRVPGVLLPEAEGVRYVVSWQRTVPAAQFRVESIGLREREDVVVTEIEGRGLCRNRNYGIETALGLLDDALEDAVFVIADDDERLMPEAIERIRAVYERYPKMDGALFRLRSTTDGEYFKAYPPTAVAYGRHPRSYYVCSWEMTFRARVWHAGIRFNEHFGLGSEQLCAGEEEVLMTDMMRKGMRVLIVPEDIGYTDPVTTGDRELDAKVLRSKGAVYAYKYGPIRAIVRAMREAAGLAIRHRCNPWKVLKEMYNGQCIIDNGEIRKEKKK